MNPHDTVAVFGVSQDPSKYGHKIFKTLLAKGFTVFAINPKGGQVLGAPVYTKLADLPQRAHTVIMVIPPQALPAAVEQCIACGVKEIWFQPGAQSQEAFDLAVRAGIDAQDGCFMAENGLW